MYGVYVSHRYVHTTHVWRIRVHRDVSCAFTHPANPRHNADVCVLAHGNSDFTSLSSFGGLPPQCIFCEAKVRCEVSCVCIVWHTELDCLGLDNPHLAEWQEENTKIETNSKHQKEKLRNHRPFVACFGRVAPVLALNVTRTKGLHNSYG